MGKPLDGSRNHRITLPEAAEAARRHRGGGPIRAGDSGAFNAAPVLELLAQKGCVGVRFYLGRDKVGDRSMILVGVDTEGNNMTEGVLVDSHFPCPPYCPDPDELSE